MSTSHHSDGSSSSHGAQAPFLALLQAQQGVWAAQSMDPASPRYNCGGYLEFQGELDVSLLRQVVAEATLDTPALRLGLREVDGQPRQFVRAEAGGELEDVTLEAEASPMAAALSLMKRDLMTPQDLAEGTLVRQVLFRLGERHHLLYLRFHHILMDGFGQVLHWRRIADAYNGRAAPRRHDALTVLLREESDYLASPRHDTDLAYFKDMLEDAPDPVRLGREQARHARGLLRETGEAPASLKEALRRRAGEAGVRWSVLLLAGVAAFLARVGRQEEVLLAVPVSTRLTATARDTPSMMANELPLSVRVESGATLGSLAQHVGGQVRSLLAHQRVRGEEVGRALGRMPHERPLTGVVVNIISFDEPVVFEGLDCHSHHLSTGPVDDLLVGFYGSSDAARLQVCFDANPGRHAQEDLSRHRERFLHFLAALLDQALDRPVGDVGLATPHDLQRLQAFHRTQRPYDLETTLHGQVEAQARRTPEAIALSTDDGRTLAYAELDRRADEVAARLVALGVEPGHRVGVCDERSFELVVSLLAVLKAGAAYVPLDPELPSARLAFQIDDAGIALVLLSSRLEPVLDGIAVTRLAVDTLPRAAHADAPLSRGQPADAAYVLFTSGTTGRPKAVAVPHVGVVNRLAWMQEAYGLTRDDCVLQKTPFTFDVSVWEFFWPLLVGARLHLARPQGHRDPRYLQEVMAREAVSTVHFVPPMLDLFLEESGALPALRRVVCSGEALRPDTVRRFFQRFPEDGDAGSGVGLHNLYGPTEASIDVTAWTCRPRDADGTVPIGHAIANTRIHLLDPHGHPVPPGVAGELYIGGVQVAIGYVNRPELTRERFIPDPFGPGRLYRTGDLARHRADGAVEFLGRLDHQVKIRGLRIELGEIEAALAAHASVRQAAVGTWRRDERGPAALVAYVVPHGSRGVDAGALSAFLQASLPEYMVPAHFVELEQLPLSSSGKLDRKALPAPTTVARIEPATESDTPLERMLRQAWSQVLELPAVGLDDVFFSIGGDSMLAIRLRSLVERQGHTFALQALFKFPTVRQLATHVRPHVARRSGVAPFALVGAADRARMPADVVDAYPLSAMQLGMLYHADLDHESAAYRVVTSLRLAGALDEAALKRALADTFSRHPSLRCSFHLSRFSEPLQLVHESVDIPLDVSDDHLGITDPARLDAVLRDWVQALKFRRFDAERAPLLAFVAHRLAGDRFQLTVVEHHVVLDGWSDIAMLDEVVRRYKAALAGQDLWLPAVGSTYGAFVAEERRVVADVDARRFWLDYLAGAHPSELPSEGPQALADKAPRHRSFQCPLGPALSRELRRQSQELGLPLKSLLVAAHVAVLRSVCAEPEVLTGLIANGRLEEEGAEDVVGVFLNTLPLRADCRGRSLLDLARHVFAFEQMASAYRRYPYARIQRDRGDDFRLDSYVNYMDFHVGWQSSAASDVQDSFGVAETNFPLAVNFLVEPGDQSVRLWLDADMARLSADFAGRLTGYYRQALEAIARDPSQSLDSLDLLPPDEHERLRRWTATPTPYDAAATVHGLFERQAARTPEATALVHLDARLSYGALEARANQLAHHLQAQGVQRGDRVGVALPRGLDMVIALLGVMKAGAAYVPLDPDYPAERLDYIVEDAGIVHVVAQAAAPSGPQARLRVLVDTQADAIAARPTSAPVPAAEAGAAAYVIYTSGSTGRPKGTRIRHRNVANFFAGMDERIGIEAEDVVLALTSISFDISVLELLWPLTRGAGVVVAPERMIANLSPADQGDEGPAPAASESLSELCERHGATLVQATPSFYAAAVTDPRALRALARIRKLLIGGEAFPVGLAARLAQGLERTRIFNMYGPTETTVWSTVHELDRARDLAGRVVPIGRPIANTDVLVLDDRGLAVPTGVAGELWIGGDGVSGLYLGRPELTAERFVAHPSGPGLFYRTGDRVRWRADGLLEFQGRVDRQVKILGHRVEPDEVEGVLSRHADVEAVAVVVCERPDGSPELVAYVAPNEAGAQGGMVDGHVRRWGDVWDSAYKESAALMDGDEGARFQGWRSSYTGDPIPHGEMQEWLDHTVRRIAAFAPRRLVDVGVGVGLILRAFADRVDHYVGMDVAASAIGAARAALTARGQAAHHVDLLHGDAMRLAELPDASADTVVINSVIQYFPSVAYLEQVLAQSWRVVAPSGRLFIGDVRDLALLEIFHASVQLARAEPLKPAAALRDDLSRQIAQERELCLTSDYFSQLSARLFDGAPVLVEIKPGAAANELNAFRFDVTIGHGLAPGAAEVLAWDDGLDAGAMLARLGARLSDPVQRGALALHDVHDDRLARSLALWDALQEADAQATAWDVERLAWGRGAGAAVNPAALAALAAAAGWRLRMTPARSGRIGLFDACFERLSEPAFDPVVAPTLEETPSP